MKFLLTVIFFIFWVSSSIADEKKIGFYKGIILISGSAGSSFYFGGSLLDREKTIQKSLSHRSILGATPLKAYYTTEDLPAGVNLPASSFNIPSSHRISLEYGLFERIGIGLSYSGMSMDVNHNIENIDYLEFAKQDTFNPAGITFIEAIPKKTKFYRDSAYSVTASFHFFEKTRFDPFIYLDAGFLQFKSSSRKLWKDSIYESSEIGTGFHSRLGGGFNYYFIPEFGLNLEVSAQKKWLKNNIIRNANLYSAQIQIGVIYNMETIIK